MKLKVLGSDSGGNCYLLQGDKETLILEAGLKFKEIKKGLGFNLSNVVGCLVTHEHGDHAKAIDEMASAGIDIYASEGTLTRNLDAPIHRLFSVKDLCQFRVGSFVVLPFRVEHDAAEPLGYLIEHTDMGKLLFVTDTYYLKYKFNELNHILVECNYSQDILDENIESGLVHPTMKKRLLESHFELNGVVQMIEANDMTRVKNIVLLHLSNHNSDAELFQETIHQVSNVETYIADRGAVGK
jgi:phosphoribosyl 1,2-cyclic phosphodiesterase